MKLTTPIEPVNFNFSATYNTRFVSIGSCFAESMAGYLKSLKFKILSNPSGVVYNPISIASHIENAIYRHSYTENDLNLADGLYYSYDFHGIFSHHDKQECLSLMNQRMAESYDALSNCNILLVTFGSSWVYTLNSTGKIVANCHKQPATIFTRTRLQTAEIVDVWSSLITQLSQLNPGIQIVFTVSPVRHLRDGAHANNLSKAVLLLSAEALCSKFANCHYFPSYEIILDELRDYRFYAGDWVHPNQTATDIIWERFANSVFTPETIRLTNEVENINKALSHRVFNKNAASYSKFEEYLKSEIDRINALIPGIEF